MKRAVLQDIKKLTQETVPVPECPQDGLLIEVKACAVCATDVKIYNYGHRLLELPRVLGHEIAGVINQVGEQLKDRFTPGQRVAVCAVVNCGECLYCRRAQPSMCLDLKAFGYHYDGGYQEYMIVPNRAICCGVINFIADHMSFEQAALAELLACCINGQRLSEVQLGQNMLIMGAGPVGILQGQLAKNNGIGEIYFADIADAKLKQVQDICGQFIAGTINSGNSETFVKQVTQITQGKGFDQVMVCCSAGAAQQVALECVAKCGCINLFGGLPEGKSQVLLDTNQIHYKQCRVIGTHGSSVEDNFIALDMIARGRIDVAPLISNLINLDQLENALVLSDQNSDHLKTVVVFSRQEKELSKVAVNK